MREQAKQKTYFGLEIFSNGYCPGVKESDIKRLPFYEFWLKKSLGSTQGVFVDENGKAVVSVDRYGGVYVDGKLYVNGKEYKEDGQEARSKV